MFDLRLEQTVLFMKPDKEQTRESVRERVRCRDGIKEQGC